MAFPELSDIVAIGALATSLVTLYYSALRRGKLRVLPPRTYDITTLPAGRPGAARANMAINMGLTFENTGVTHKAVLDIRLKATHRGTPPAVIDFELQMEHPPIPQPPEDSLTIAEQFSLKGGDCITKYFRFVSNKPDDRLQVGDHLVDVLLYTESGWKRYLQFPLKVDSTMVEYAEEGWSLGKLALPRP